MGKNNAVLYDPKMLISAGIDPKTGLPLKFDGLDCYGGKENIKKQLEIVDRQDAINRYVWHFMPPGIDGRLMERILYYRGQGALFKLENRFYFLPFALDGTIDVYGRYTGITPLPFNGTFKTSGADEKPWIAGLKFKPVYDVQLPEDFIDMTEEEIREFTETSCVIFKDYTEGISQNIEPRYTTNDQILDYMSECFPFMRTALINSTGVQGMRVNDESEAASVYAANNAITRAALTGDAKIPIVGQTGNFQDLANGNTAHAEEFLLAMQSLDNYRLSLYGLDNGGLFQKKSHMLEAEQEMNRGNAGLLLNDGLTYRQQQATIANSIWGSSMWVELSETTISMDVTGDGIAGSDEKGQWETMNEEEESNELS